MGDGYTPPRGAAHVDQSLFANVERRTGRLITAAPSNGVLQSSVALAWCGVAAELHRIAPDCQPEHYVRTHRLMVQTGPPARFEMRHGPDWRTYVLRPGDVTVLPDGTLNEPRWHDTLEFVAIGLDPAFVAESFGDAIPGLDVRLTPSVQCHDETIVGLARLLKAEIGAAGHGEALFAETVALALSRHLLVRLGPGVTEPRGTLAGPQLARVIDYLDAHLTTDVRLEALACEARLSPFHFARLFRATTRLSPHQFVIRRRVDRARRLLRSDLRLGLAEVAVAAGFFDQAHFSKVFRAVLGTTPAAYRQQILDG